jgi:uncharacterized protein (TIGR00369 family)
MSGLDFMRALKDGSIPTPPVAKLLGYRVTRIEEGLAVFEFEAGEHVFNPLGMVHGGVVSTLLDTAMGCAVHSMLPAGNTYSTAEIKVNFIRPVTRVDGRLLCEGRVIHVGKRLATAEGRLMDEDQKLYAHGLTTCMIFR